MSILWRIILIGFAVLGFIGVGITTLIVVLAINMGDSSPEMPEVALLRINLDGEFREGGELDSFSSFSEENIYDLYGTIQALNHGANNPKILGLYATLNDTSMGLAQVQELRQAILNFRKSGKPTVVFSESLGSSGGGVISYYLASAFETIILQPSGHIATMGLSAETPFLRDTLKLIGVTPEMGGRKEYKNAIASLTETGYTPAHAENVQALLDSWLKQMSQGVAKTRGISIEEAVTFLGNGPHLAASARNLGLVTELGYWDQAWSKATRTDKSPEDQDAPTEIDITEYMEYMNSGIDINIDHVRIALIVGEGEITSGTSQETWDSTTGFGSETLSQAIRDAANDETIEGIILRINSPGGSYVASDTIRYEVKRATKKKPVIVSMGDMAASGGYFIAAPASMILASPSTITGSIGVFSGKMVLADLWEKLEVHWGNIDRGQSAGMWSPNRPFDDWGWEKLNQSLDAIYADFTAKVAEERDMTPEEVEAAAKGRVWTGAEALEQGLVDRLGGLEDAKIAMVEMLEMDDETKLNMILMPEATPSWERLSRLLGGNFKFQQQIGQLLTNIAPLHQLLAPLASSVQGSQIQAQAPEFITKAQNP